MMFLSKFLENQSIVRQDKSADSLQLSSKHLILENALLWILFFINIYCTRYVVCLQVNADVH